jgi:hypothetical protein
MSITVDHKLQPQLVPPMNAAIFLAYPRKLMKVCISPVRNGIQLYRLVSFDERCSTDPYVDML